MEIPRSDIRFSNGSGGCHDWMNWLKFNRELRRQVRPISTSHRLGSHFEVNAFDCVCVRSLTGATIEASLNPCRESNM